MKRKVNVIGSTGSIGTQTLEICDIDKNLSVVALAAGANDALMEKQARKYHPRICAMFDTKAASRLKVALADTDIKVLSGEEGVAEAAAFEADITLTAIVGIAGLKSTLAAIDAGRDIALANKETLVTAGETVMRMAKEKGVNILPVDSEHSAIFQSVSNQAQYVKKLIITASGGPFFGMNRAALAAVSAKDALKHPNWNMGAKITVDSATLVNKGLEVIEAMHLFDVGIEDIETVVHRQSIVHSLVEFCDGSVIAQMGIPNMKLPISYALHYPNRAMEVEERLSLTKVGVLTFEEIDHFVFRGVKLAERAAKAGGTLPAALNGANEAAVGAFLQGKCTILDIYDAIEGAMDNCVKISAPLIEDIIQCDKMAREYVQIHLKGQK
ncbi:MAG: 1-deoxy-D-xylulose-5-phosphate reductoisomerase [Clostridia bacterium]|nr:1-deoxy-D-xylulose-5-phosphate reductoisomerase [Clostridia bacterium]